MRSDEYDWSRFSITFFYPVSIEVAYRAWATKAGLESFFVDVADFTVFHGGRRSPDELIATGDQYNWTWRHDFGLSGEIRSADLNSEIVFTFGSMVCRVGFEAVDPSTTKVVLEQTQISDDAEGRVMGHLNCRSCWTFFMTNLKSVLVTGTDLRDGDPERVSSMEVGFAGV